MKTTIMPEFSRLAGVDRASNYPEGVKYPVFAVVREAAKANNRQGGSVKVAQYGIVEFTLTPKEHNPAENWLDWEHTSENGTKTQGRWQQGTKGEDFT